jgi:hypothetical protein
MINKGEVKIRPSKGASERGQQVNESINPSLRRLNHRGHTVLLADYSGLRGDDLVNAIKTNEDVAVSLGKSGDQKLLLLTDVTTATVGTDALTALKKVSAAIRPYTLASAVVGITTARKYMLQVVNAFAEFQHKPVDSVEAGLDWLVDRAEKED